MSKYREHVTRYDKLNNAFVKKKKYAAKICKKALQNIKILFGKEI